MLLLKEMYKYAKRNADMKNETDIVEYYMDKFREEIGDSKSKLLVYKNQMNKKTDLEIPAFWMSTLAVFLANVSTFIAMLSGKSDYVSKISETEAAAVFVFIMVMGVALYYIAMKERKNYSLMKLSLEEIERELNKE